MERRGEERNGEEKGIGEGYLSSACTAKVKQGNREACRAGARTRQTDTGQTDRQILDRQKDQQFGLKASKHNTCCTDQSNITYYTDQSNNTYYTDRQTDRPKYS